MSFAADPFGVAPFGAVALVAPDEPIYPAAYTAALVKDRVAWAVLADVTTYFRTTGDADQFGAPIFGVAPFGDLPGGLLVTTEGQAVERYSDVGWIGDPDDAQAPNVPYWPRVAGLRYNRAIPLIPEVGTRANVQLGALRLANGDRALDSLAERGVSGFPVTIRLGEKADAFDDFGVAVQAVGDLWRRQTDALELTLRGLEHRLEVLLQENLYAGTGGANGTADNEGQPKPLAYGECFNVTPVLIDPANLVYQVGDGAIDGVAGAYDGMADLTLDTDYASYAALAAASLSDGEYATCTAEGLVRVDFDLADSFGLTLDVQGQAAPTYSTQAGEIARRLCLAVGLTNDDIHLEGLAALSWHQGTVGLYVTQPLTAAEALTALVRGVGGWWGVRRDGKVTAGLWEPPAAGYDLDIGVTEILDIRGLNMPEAIGPGNWRRRIHYKRNWTPLTKDQIAGTVIENEPARAQFAQTQWRTETASEPARQTQHRRATDPAPLESVLNAAADAATLADRLLDAFDTDRRLLAVTVPAVGFLADVGETIRITWPGYGLEGGRRMRVMGIEEDLGRRRCTLTLWG